MKSRKEVQLTPFFNNKKSRKVYPLVFKVKILRELKPNLDFEGLFNYLNNGKLIKINTTDLPALIKKGLIKPTKQIVRELNFEPKLTSDGFECRYLPDNIQKLLAIYSQSSPDEQIKVRAQIREAIESLVSTHFSLPAVAFDTVYRNTAEKKGFTSVHLAHVDFPNDNLHKTLDSFRNQWQPRVKEKIGDKYKANELEFMVNIWMPLNTVVASPLALCSNKIIDSKRMHEYDAVRRDTTAFKAVSLTPPEKQNDPWFYKPDMKGKCYMFLSTKTIHSAVKFPNETSGRESIEVRVGLFKK